MAMARSPYFDVPFLRGRCSTGISSTVKPLETAKAGRNEYMVCIGRKDEVTSRLNILSEQPVSVTPSLSNVCRV